MPKTKICSKCQKRKPLKQFYKLKSGVYGRHSQCCECHHFCAHHCASYRRQHKPQNHQIAETMHTFPCGCTGLLPKHNQSSVFACAYPKLGFMCRITSILINSAKTARRGGYKPIPQNTSHQSIRMMMTNPNCVQCGLPLSWSHLAIASTPHLHHNHKTGEIYGFTHPRCNPRALEQENDRLRTQLKTVLSYYGQPVANLASWVQEATQWTYSK